MFGSPRAEARSPGEKRAEPTKAALRCPPPLNGAGQGARKQKPHWDFPVGFLINLAVPTFALVGTIIGLKSLTTVFGMGTGVAFSVCSPEKVRRTVRRGALQSVWLQERHSEDRARGRAGSLQPKLYPLHESVG